LNGLAESDEIISSESFLKFIRSDNLSNILNKDNYSENDIDEIKLIEK